jgi:hypothetical protein
MCILLLTETLTSFAIFFPDLVIPTPAFPLSVYYNANSKCLQYMSRVGIALAVTTSIPTDGEIVYSPASSTTFIFSLCVYKGMGRYPSDTSYTSCISQCGVVLMCILLLTETLTSFAIFFLDLVIPLLQFHYQSADLPSSMSKNET